MEQSNGNCLEELDERMESIFSGIKALLPDDDDTEPVDQEFKSDDAIAGYRSVRCSDGAFHEIVPIG